MENNGQKWYVYAHTNPINGETFYIGKGTGKRGLTIESRNSQWKRYVQRLELTGVTYSVHILHICSTNEEALDLERIEIHSRLGAFQPLLNKIIPQKKEYPPVFTDTSELIHFVRLKRRSLKLTQKQTSERAGVGLRFIRELEAGKQTLRMDKVNEVLRLFGSKLVPK